MRLVCLHARSRHGRKAARHKDEPDETTINVSVSVNTDRQQLEMDGIRGIRGGGMGIQVRVRLQSLSLS